MTKTNQPHAKISRQALMEGIAAMKELKPKEKEELTQKEAIEIAAEVVQDLLGKGYSMAEIIEMMKENFGLTLNVATVRNYLRQAKAANDAAAEQKPVARRGRKAKSVIAPDDAGKIDGEAAGDKLAHYSAALEEEMQIDTAGAREEEVDITDTSARDDAQDGGEMPGIEHDLKRDELYEMLHGKPNPNLKGRG